MQKRELNFLGNSLPRRASRGNQPFGMHIVYVDESGDLGGAGSPSRFFILSALVVSHEHWQESRGNLDSMRSALDRLYGLRTSAEIHAAQFLGGAASHLGLDIRRRFQCAHHALEHLGRSTRLRPIRVAVKKDGESGKALLDRAWDGLLNEIGLELASKPTSPCGSGGLVVIMDHHGASPYRPSEVSSARVPLLELPFGRRSEDSPLLQCADLLGFLTKQSLDPNRHFSGSRGRALINLAERIHGVPCPVHPAK